MSASDSFGSWVDYDYATVRLVPRVHVGAFLNIGVILHVRTLGFLDVRFRMDRERIATAFPGLDLDLLERFVEGYRRACVGGEGGGAIGLLPPSERFHWLTAPRSAVLQTSPVHPGRCHDPFVALDRLFQEQCADQHAASPIG